MEGHSHRTRDWEPKLEEAGRTLPWGFWRKQGPASRLIWGFWPP